MFTEAYHFKQSQTFAEECSRKSTAGATVQAQKWDENVELGVD